ncbi:MAG: hypothetical protein QF827_03200 [Alphaproteobacteria bacterium]|jgi:4-amino-4-deoxy-L-arabinose transferase-like glycosyltransferase|nr:hypothetical protein [Alphaproteobacteria bacterium]
MTAADHGRQPRPDAGFRTPVLRAWAIVTQYPLIATFGLALALRLGYVLALYGIMGDAGLGIDDSIAYWAAAENLVRHGDLVMPGLDGGLVPETAYMPLYPLFLAAHIALTGGTDPLWPALSQALIDSAACVVIALLAGKFGRGYVPAAGLFAACNPTQIVIAGMILTDGLFLFWCALALLAAAGWLRRPGWPLALLLGGALALALATRAMMLPWALAVPVLLAAGGALLGRITFGRGLQLGAALALCLAAQSPILIRNFDHYQALALTSQAGTHFLLWLAPLVREAADGTAHGAGAAANQRRYEAQADPDEGANPFRRSRAMSALALTIMAQLGPVTIARAWGIGAAINLLGPSVILAPPVRTLPRIGFYDTPGASKLDKVVSFLFRNDNPTYGWVLLIGVGGTGLLRLIQLRGLARAARGGAEARIGGLLMLAWIGFILAINGPVASAKYRQPAEPAFAVLFALGVVRPPPRAAPG